MANNMMKKTLALVLAASLCVSQLALPALATGNEESQTTLTITVTAETSDTTTDPATGVTTTTEHIEGVDHNGSDVVVDRETTTETTKGPNGVDTTTDTTWTETQTTTDTNGDTEKTTTTGSDTASEEYTNIANGDQGVVISGSGSETSVTEEQEQGPTSGTDVVLDKEFASGGSDNTVPGASSSDSQGNPDNEADWTLGTPEANENGWVQDGKTEYGQVEMNQPTQVGETTVVYPTPAEDQTLNLNPDGQKVTVEVDITLKDLMEGKYLALYNPTTDAGKTVTEVKDANGNVIGYSVGDDKNVMGVYENGVLVGFEITETTRTDNPATATPTDDPTFTVDKVNDYVGTSTTIDEFEDKLKDAVVDENGKKTSVSTTKDAANNDVTTTVETITDANGNSGYRETIVTVIPTDTTTTTVSADLNDPNVKAYQDEQVTEKYFVEMPAAMPTAYSNKDNGDGTFTTVTVKEILESNGTCSIKDVVGYEMTTVITDAAGNVQSTTTVINDHVVPNAVTDRDNGNKTFTTVTVDPILRTSDSKFGKTGDVMGHTITTVLKDEDGNILETKVREIFGTEVTETTTVNTDPTTLVTTTSVDVTKMQVREAFAAAYTRDVDMTASQTKTYTVDILETTDTYQLAKIDGKLCFIYEGIMYEVKEIAGGANGDRVGYDLADSDNISLNGYTNADNIQSWHDYGVVLDKNGDHVHSWSGMNSGLTPDNNSKTWELDGYGLVTNYFVSEKNFDNGDGSHGVQMYRIINKENGQTEVRYVYCVELGKVATDESKYSELVFDSEGNNNTGTAKDNKYWLGYEDYLVSIALNGFWGTSSGIGSLDTVRALLARHGKTDAAENITAGQALTATQVALWKYASPNGNEFSNDDFVWLINNPDSSKAEKEPDNKGDNVDKKSQHIYTLYNLLLEIANIEANDGRSNASQGITKDDIKDGSITVKDAQSGGLYNTELSFTVDVSASSLKESDVKVSLTNGGTQLGVYTLAESNPNNDPTILVPDANGKITISGMNLAPGTKVDVALTGTQTIDNGIYIYNNKDSQDFMGLATKLHDVALQFGLWFDLIDPELNYTKHQATGSQKATMHFKTDASREDTMTTLTTTTYENTRTQMAYTSQLNGVVTSSTVFSKVTLENVRWEYYYEYALTVIDDDDGDDQTTIIEEDVPLADAPKTGDPSIIMAIMSAVSMAGATVLGRKKEEE